MRSQVIPRDRRFVYVPAGGSAPRCSIPCLLGPEVRPISLALAAVTVSYRSGLRCCNDHMFVCPRELCSPYASLLDNFRDARCRAPPGYSSGGDGVKLDGTLREAPDLTWTSWYLSRAYNGHRSTDTLRHERCALSSP